MNNPLEKPAFTFAVAIISGLFIPQFSEGLGTYIIPLFVVAMALSTRHIKLSRKDVVSEAPLSIRPFLLNYGFLAGMIILLTYLLVPSSEHVAGFVIMAALPPAVIIVPFTYILKGDTKLSLSGEVMNYILALLMAPLITVILLGFAVSVFDVLKALALMIILPIMISRVCNRLPQSIFSQSKSITNICLSLIAYTIIGLNQHAIFSETMLIIPLLFVNFMTTFGTGIPVYLISKKLGVKYGRSVSYALFAGLKNGGMTAAVAISLVSTAAALPAALHPIFTITFFMFLQFLVKRI